MKNKCCLLLGLITLFMYMTGCTKGGFQNELSTDNAVVDENGTYLAVGAYILEVVSGQEPAGNFRGLSEISQNEVEEPMIEDTVTVLPYVEDAEGEELEASVQKEGILVAIDPGHQSKGNSEKEPIGPGASETKAKVAGGTRGVSTGVYEYQLTLDVSLKLRDELQARGYQVYMVRETNDVNISNSERAVMSADAGADVLIRIHANGSENTSASGIMTICPTAANPYCSSIYSDSRRLSDEVLNHMLTQTGAASKGVWETDTMSGINWCTIPVTIVEMGFMSNPTEDALMQTEEYQDKMVKGMADGIDAYFLQ